MSAEPKLCRVALGLSLPAVPFPLLCWLAPAMVSAQNSFAQGLGQEKTRMLVELNTQGSACQVEHLTVTSLAG